ncbi:SDR family NAD(P)-dependent oxidoreductase [Mesorhizobium australafricanum]|uniref:SDR family oxidoreductase n=1 Tax=Mesorhizobium australafricanum TaxID=3072311 RepID=A0ABU4X4K7_9HYPH|nr:SDR family oxidoreductase [Mesorhizobium sp. VK3E]MDX8443247.1 SDR family oxidoreductase [Mesorhizobium sp. VK3E]
MTTRPIALITGGSRGLGRNTALHLARRGVDVIVTYRSRADEAKSAIAEIGAAGGRAAALELDTGAVGTFPAFVAALKKTLQETWQRDRFDYLVNNAGTGLRKMIAETTEEEFDTLMNTHLKGVFFLTQALLPLINDGGRIVNISSGLARFAAPGSSAYAMMKGGIEVFTRYLAKELGARGITANTVAPGAIATDFNGGHVRDDAEINRMVAGVTALGRAGVADDIGPMIASLLSDDNRWVNAQRIEVSGGMNI